jgi:hypothetical protein
MGYHESDQMRTAWENNYGTLYIVHRCGQDRGRDERAHEAADGTKNPTEYKRLGRNPAAKEVISKLGPAAPAGSTTRPTKPGWWAGSMPGGRQRE